MILGSVVYLFVPQQRTKYYLAPLDSIALPLCSVWMQLAFCKGNFSKNVFSRFLLRYTTCFGLKKSVFFCVYDLNLVFWSQAYLLGILNLGLLLGLLGLARLSFLWCYLTWYRISANNFCGNYSFLKVEKKTKRKKKKKGKKRKKKKKKKKEKKKNRKRNEKG